MDISAFFSLSSLQILMMLIMEVIQNILGQDFSCVSVIQLQIP